MGQLQQSIKQKIMPKKKVKVFMAGNPSSGRTTMLYKWLKQDIQAQPTMGFNVERIVYKNIEFEMWDGGGGENMRKLWEQQMDNVKALILVLDSSDLKQDSDYLQNQINKLLINLPKSNLPFLILSNKKDLYQSSEQQILEYVNVSKFKDQIIYHIIHTNSISGEGLKEALDWLYNNLK